MTSTYSRVSAQPRERALRSEEGSILMLTVLSMVALLGVVALAVDGSYMYTERNRMSAAADAAARAGAQEYRRNTSSNLQAFANREVVRHGFNPAAGTTVTVNRPPSSGPFTANQNYVEVIVSRPTASFFASILSNVWSTFTPGARAVAGTSSGPNCITTLQTGSTSLTVGGTVDLDLSSCNIQANGNMHVGNGSGSVTAGGIAVEGTCTGCPSGAVQGAPRAPDPLATLPVPTNPYSTPTTVVIGNNQPTVTLTPGWYNKISVGNSSEINFQPGFYWISGPIITGNGAELEGSGVFFYLDGTASAGPCTLSSVVGCINIPNGGELELSAQTSGPYEGILFFQARSNRTNATFGNSGEYEVSGAMYFPAADVSYGNSGSSNDCTLFVANTLQLGTGGGGNLDFENTCSAYGGSPILTVTLAE
ncbi:MAG: pilus assembly protein TadG-related protein [Vicinamibacterales bacterium]